jgi:hypothetical protein
MVLHSFSERGILFRAVCEQSAAGNATPVRKELFSQVGDVA